MQINFSIQRHCQAKDCHLRPPTNLKKMTYHKQEIQSACTEKDDFDTEIEFQERCNFVNITHPILKELNIVEPEIAKLNVILKST